jgi:hypothetical protein
MQVHAHEDQQEEFISILEQAGESRILVYFAFAFDSAAVYGVTPGSDTCHQYDEAGHISEACRLSRIRQLRQAVA